MTRYRSQTDIRNMSFSRAIKHDADYASPVEWLSHHNKQFIAHPAVPVGFASSGIYDELGRHKRISRFKPWINPIHDCHHTKTQFEPAGDVTITSGQSYGDSVTFTTAKTYSPAAAIPFYELGVSDLTNIWGTATQLGTFGTYADVDWVALYDSFYEASNSQVPQTFFFGEDAVESDIFIDAFKMILNPSKSIKTLFAFMKDFGRHGKHFPLGAMKHAVKGLANGKLLYEFAIKPAIHDIRATIDAHKVISERLHFMNSHRGSFIPIKVRQKTKSDVDEGLDPGQNYATWRGPYARTKERAIIGSMSAWGLLRADVTVQPSWSAYVSRRYGT